MALSTMGESEVTMGTSNDALATIAGLRQRVEWLEESIGKLLVRALFRPSFPFLPGHTDSRMNMYENADIN